MDNVKKKSTYNTYEIISDNLRSNIPFLKSKLVDKNEFDSLSREILFREYLDFAYNQNDEYIHLDIILSGELS